jgi:uncharacterized protein YcaQ
VKLTKREAQALAVIASRLDRRPSRRKVTRDDILDVIRHLGMIQLDTISVISRSHETALWSRLGPYDTALITQLFIPDRALTEYLAHAAAIVPTESLFLFRPYMERVRAEDERWIHQPENAAVAKAVLDRIRLEGPLSSRDFEAPPDARRHEQWESWYGNKPERQVLAHLWHQGDLMVHLRDQGFARWFDLPERVAPGFWDGDAISMEESQRTMLGHALHALGVTTVKWASDYFRTGGRYFAGSQDTRRILDEMTKSGQAIPVEIDGVKGPAWMDPALVERLELLRERKEWPTLTTFLSPFDNLIWNRDRGERLWDFSYRLEIYVPAPKRIYGYYSLPILHQGRIIGRLDPSFNRKQGVLTIKALHLEPGVRPGDSLAKAISRAIEDLLAFLGGKPGAWRLGPDVSPHVIELLRPHAGLILHAAD